jgi:hypothetical protein
MAGPDGELTVSQRLGRALDRGLLPAGGPAEAAERLIERLDRPARVALLGLPGAGKSAVLNLLAGTVVVPETLRLPTIIVQHGDVARMICTLTDGGTKIIAGSDLSEVLPLAPALVTLEMDLPSLKVISLLEVSAGPMEAEQRRAASWASKRADIVIWCTTSYLPKEQAVWESLPDGVKDNSFMFLTKVDLLGNREAASAMHERVELRAGEEFRQILSLSAKQARAAMPPGGPVDRDMFRDSGASGVIGAIKTRVQSGRRADMDMAELLLARHVEAGEIVSRRFAEPETAAPEPETWEPPPDIDLPESSPDPDPIAYEPTAEPDPFATRVPQVEPEVEDPAVDEMVFEDVLPGPEPAEKATPELAEEPEPQVEDEPEPEPEEEPDQEPEPVLAHEQVVEPTPEPEPESYSEPEVLSELPPEIEDEVEDAPQPAADEPEAEPAALGSESGLRRRFADRIKRMPVADEVAAAPAIPRRATWKSKAEVEAQYTPEPQPTAPRAHEPRRRPEAPSDDAALARPATDTTPVARERVPRPDVPSSSPRLEAARAARPQLFGSRKPAAGPQGTESPPPDLASLRAQPEPEPEEIAEADLVEEPSAPVIEPVIEAAEGDSQPVAEEAEDAEAAAPIEEVAEAPPAKPEPPTKPVEVRLPRPEPQVQPRPDAMPRSPRPEASVAAPPPTPSDESQFAPRAIVMRERRSDPDGPTPRRERPRIAARAVAAAPAAPAPVSSADHALLEEAIGLIVSRSADLQASVDPEAKVPVDMILDHSRETTELVMEVVSRGRTEALRRISGDLGEVLDLIMLMQLEKGHAPADDALTLLLQLRRDLETLRAA